MTTILKTGIERIMRIFHENKGKEFHLREISRRANLEGQSIMRHLKQLESLNLLKSRREGNQKYYKARQKAFPTYLLFDIEKFDSLPHIRREAISIYLKALPQQPVYAVLFGSTAKGTHNENSDVDILIITNSRIDTKGAEKEAGDITTTRISTFQMTLKDFRKELKMKEDMVIQSAIATGYPLTNHIQYYLETLHEGI